MSQQNSVDPHQISNTVESDLGLQSSLRLLEYGNHLSSKMRKGILSSANKLNRAFSVH